MSASGTDDRLLTALRFADTAFPGGGFAFSQGLEGLGALVGRRPVAGEVARFLREQIRHRWAGADRVALVRAFRAGDDWERVAAIDQELDRATLFQPLREGARRNGRALLATHVRLRTPSADRWRAMIEAGRAPGTLSCVQGIVWRASGLGEAQAVALSGYGLVSSGLAAAVRLNLVGALAAQGEMAALLDEVAACALSPVADEQDIAGFSPFSEIASARQAGLSLRLFSN